MKEIEENNKSFEDIKHIDKNGVEYWYANRRFTYSKKEFKAIGKKKIIIN